MEPITWESLATVAGAGVGAGLVTQFVKIFVRDKLSDAGYRMIAAAAGLVIVLAASLIAAEITVQLILLAVLVGLQAGLSASQAYEGIRHGFDHQAIKK